MCSSAGVLRERSRLVQDAAVMQSQLQHGTDVLGDDVDKLCAQTKAVTKACYTCVKRGNVGTDLKYCQRCKSALYCSVECQRCDWYPF